MQCKLVVQIVIKAIDEYLVASFHLIFLTEFEEDTESEVGELGAGEGEAADPRAAAADAGEAGHEAAHPRRAHLVLLEADLHTQRYTVHSTQYTVHSTGTALHGPAAVWRPCRGWRRGPGAGSTAPAPAPPARATQSAAAQPEHQKYLRT